jgi:nitrite reductase/ring-hydroxylating ferredoxin subunit
MPKHVVARVDEIAPGSRKRIIADGRAIVVFNLKGEFFALSDTCPHRGASLSGGKLTGLVQSNGPGEYAFSRDGEIVRCPWHAWEFDIRTGRSYCDPRRFRVTHYPAEIASGSAIVEGAYTAETFKVAIDHDYLVIDVP